MAAVLNKYGRKEAVDREFVYILVCPRGGDWPPSGPLGVRSGPSGLLRKLSGPPKATLGDP